VEVASEIIKMPVIGYARVSTREQKLHGISPEVQKALLADYAKLRGLDLVEIIYDGGVSAGKPLSRRPGGRRLLDSVRSGKVKGVVSMKLDRLFRNALECLEVVQGWDQNGIALHLASQGGSAIDTQSATGRFLLTIMAGVAEMERNLTCERIAEVITYKQARGERTGTVPYGYRLHLRGKRLESDPDEQAVIQHIKSLHAEGRTLREIVDSLNGEGIPARGKRWHKTTISRLLVREANPEWRPNLHTVVEDARDPDWSP
jgi:DNA invertase Pin-like site-specific DNA recombinase